MHLEAVQSIGVAAIADLLLEACRGMLTIPMNLARWRGAERVAIESNTCSASGSNDCPRHLEFLH